MSVESVRAWFPKELEEQLTFEKATVPEQGEHFIIRPRQYLGNETFAKVASIVRDNGGEYVSAGKQSHFRKPVKSGEALSTVTSDQKAVLIKDAFEYLDDIEKKVVIVKQKLKELQK